MSETVHYKGVLREVQRLKGETLEEQCKRLLNGKEKPSYFDSYAEFFADEYYRTFTIQNGVLYSITKNEVDPDFGIFNASVEANGDIRFEVRYYNGGCGFDEAIEEALKNIK